MAGDRKRLPQIGDGHKEADRCRQHHEEYCQPKADGMTPLLRTVHTRELDTIKRYLLAIVLHTFLPTWNSWIHCPTPSNSRSNAAVSRVPRIALSRRVTMLQDHPHAIHFKHILYFGEGQDQDCWAITQNSLSNKSSRGLGCRRFRTLSCCRSARFSNTSFPRPRKRQTSTPNQSKNRLSMSQGYSRRRFEPRL